MPYKIGDTIRLKPLNKLLKEKEGENGFYLQSGLFINKDMYCYLNKAYKIKNVTHRFTCHNETGYILSLSCEREWVWDDTCFETSKQLEFEF